MTHEDAPPRVVGAAPRALVPCTAFVLGMLHGYGANTPPLAALQLATFAALMTLLFLSSSRKELALTSLSALVFSLAAAAAAHSWIFTSLARDSALGAPLAACVYSALVVAIALPSAAALALSAAAVTKPSLARFAPLVLAITYPLAESASDAWLGFTWHSIGYSTLDTPLGALLPWVGVRGAAAAAVFACALLAWWANAWLLAPRARRAPPWRGIAALSSVIIALAVVRHANYLPATLQVGEPLRARLLQPARPIHGKFDSTRRRDTVRQLAALAHDPGAHLIVAPETVLPHSWALLPDDDATPLMDLVAGTPKTLLVGLFDARQDGGLLNVSVAVHADSRRVTPPRYVKRHLVPVAERRTPGLGWITDALALPLTNRVTEPGPATLFATPRATLRTTLCLDLVYGADLSEDAAATRVIVNQSNLVALPGSRVREQFLTIARARALEQRKPVLLASNDGPTAGIDADGRVIGRLPYGTSGALSVEVMPRSGVTLYAAFGDVSWLGLLALAALALCVRRSAPEPIAAGRNGVR